MNWRSDSDGTTALLDRSGRRKYLTDQERRHFLIAAVRYDRSTAAFAQLLAYSGCRISEALALTPGRLDPGTGSVVFRTLKRRRIVFRAVPIPTGLIRELLALSRDKQPEEPIWAWCRITAWRRVKAIMADCGINGAQAMPRGLRHSFGVANAEHNVPAALTQRWMGHARLETTAIYQHAVGREERAFAQRIWRHSEKHRH